MNTKTTLTHTQRLLLIWLYNQQKCLTIDEGNLLYAYKQITGEPDFKFHTFSADLNTLINLKYIQRHTTNTFYQITHIGKQFLQNSIESQITYQCPHCGDFWNSDNDDEMIIDAYLQQYPNGTTIEEICGACEKEDNITGYQVKLDDSEWVSTTFFQKNRNK